MRFIEDEIAPCGELGEAAVGAVGDDGAQARERGELLGEEQAGRGVAGRALATGAVTMTDSNIVGCTGTGKVAKHHCNQGVGNGPEGCDPGNSNQGNANRSNDEFGGTPSHPGRQGGNRNANVQAKGNSTLHSNAKSK